MHTGYTGEGHHANYDNDEYKKQYQDPGNQGYTPLEEVPSDNPNDDPLNVLIAREADEDIAEPDDISDLSVIGGHDLDTLMAEESRPTEEDPYKNFGVLTDKQIDALPVDVSGERGRVEPNLPGGMSTRRYYKELFPSKTQRANRSKPPYKDHN